MPWPRRGISDSNMEQKSGNEIILPETIICLTFLFQILRPSKFQASNFQRRKKRNLFWKPHHLEPIGTSQSSATRKAASRLWPLKLVGPYGSKYLLIEDTWGPVSCIPTINKSKIVQVACKKAWRSKGICHFDPTKDTPKHGCLKHHTGT